MCNYTVLWKEQQATVQISAEKGLKEGEKRSEWQRERVQRRYGGKSERKTFRWIDDSEEQSFMWITERWAETREADGLTFTEWWWLNKHEG